MPKYSIEVAIIISIVIYLILAFIGIKGIIQIIIMGFVATYLTEPEKSSYRIGAVAAGIIGTLFAFYSFFTGPDLPYQLPNPLQLGLGVAADSFFTTIMIFHSGEDDIFLATFRGNISKENAESYMTEFHDAYTTLVQQRTYQKLLEKIKERNLNLESEKVTEDNSIVLTLLVQE